MLCERAQELFSDYHEGAVKTAMKVPFEGHLEQCSECRMRLDGMREIWTMLDRAPIVEPPPDFRAAVWARIDAMEAEKARRKQPVIRFDWRTLFRPATLGWAAAALVIVMLAPVVIPGTRSTASLWFPWSMVYSRSAPGVSVGEPQITTKDGQRWIDLRVSNSGTAPSHVEFRVPGSSGPVAIDAQPGTDQVYRLGPAPEGASQLKATRQEGSEPNSSRYTISQ
jgi:hypothetical protein